MKLTYKLALICFIALFFSITVQAQAPGTGKQKAIGVMLGEPTGLSFKYWKNSRNAFDLGVTWSLQGNDAIGIHGDYLWHKWLDVDSGNLAFQYGIGARTWFSDGSSAAGIRIPVGLNYLFSNDPFGIFIEIAPVIDLLPATEADGNGAIGIRYYF